MIRIIFAFVVTAIGVSAVAAQSDVAGARQKLMKENSDTRGVLNRMLRNEAPYDQAAVDGALKGMIGLAKQIPSVFQPGSYKGPDPKFRYYATQKAVAPENQADVQAWAADLEKTLIAAQGKITNVASLKAVWTPINDNQCEACHKDYRARRE